MGVRALLARSHRGRGTPSALAGLIGHYTEKIRHVAKGADRQIRGQPACSRTPAAARPGGKGEISKLICGLGCCRSGEMKLHCEVEVVSRHLPALGLKNRGKGVRAVLSLYQQTPKNPPRPPAGGERGGPHPACLLISTLKDKRGTRYEVRGASRPCQGSQPWALPLSREAGGSRGWSSFWGFVSPRPLSPITAPVGGSWACPEDPKRKAFETAPSCYFSRPFLRLRIGSIAIE